jgi:hypothetical protein
MKNKNYIKNTADAGIPSTGTHTGFFEIHIKGHLDSSWADWLEGLEIKLLDNGEMVLSGDIVDQAALMGILNRLHNLNLTLLSVNKIDQKNDIKKNK